VYHGPLKNCTGQYLREVKVTVKNKRLISLDGLNVIPGPNTWFHAQLKDADGINAKAGTFETILWYPYYDPENPPICKRIQSKDIKIIGKAGTYWSDLVLPRDVTEYKSIGLYDYKNCVNLGHVLIKQQTYDDPTIDFHFEGKACLVPDDGDKADCTTGQYMGFDQCDEDVILMETSSTRTTAKKHVTTATDTHAGTGTTGGLPGAGILVVAHLLLLCSTMLMLRPHY